MLDGRKLSRDCPSSPEAIYTDFSFDNRNNLASVTLPDGRLIEYVNDGLNRRIGRKVDGSWSNKWVFSGNSLNPIADLEADGTSNKVNRLYVYATKQNIPDYMIDYEYSPARTFSLITDHLGSLRMVIDAETGEIKQKITYDEFGDIIENYVETGFSEVPFGFAGGLYDPVTGLVKFGARDYDPEIGRWISKDPILFAGGDSNLYAYVGSNPVNYVDPEGLCYIDINVSVGKFFGFTGGVQIDLNTGKIFPYAGAYAGTPGVAVTLSPNDPSPGGYWGGQYLTPAGGQVGGAISEFPTPSFVEWGFGIPGAAISAIYVFDSLN